MRAAQAAAALSWYASILPIKGKAIPFSGGFKVLHGNGNIVSEALFSLSGAFSPAAGAPAAGENRAFRGCAIAPATPPLRGAVSAPHPYNRLRCIKAICLINLEMFLIFETGIAVRTTHLSRRAHINL
jgi:hypothetical protein